MTIHTQLFDAFAIYRSDRNDQLRVGLLVDRGTVEVRSAAMSASLRGAVDGWHRQSGEMHFG
jgi:hypothetical protein